MPDLWASYGADELASEEEILPPDHSNSIE
jgi:hypothetical protein